ncbi:Uncharacterised protein [Acinetobacter baumannii]|nr:Uncharacterised protein [Acinetobacter baumannii]SSS36305.1 Uncharacterised protein [Acinetobacter baumannii]
MWMVYSIVSVVTCPNASFEFEPIIVFLISLGALLTSEYPWDYKKFNFINSSKKGLNFDLSMNNSHLVIGEKELEFDLVFSTAGNGSIHIYGNQYGSQNIQGLSIITGIQNVEDITKFEQYEYSSKVQAFTGNFVLLKNTFGQFAAIKIVRATAISHGAEKSEVDLDYWILEK